MKKTILSLLVLLMTAVSGAWARGTNSHWPDFDCYNYGHYATFMAAIKIDGVIVTANYQNWNQLEVAAFVGNECRSAGQSTNFLYNGYVEDGDPYPVFDGMKIYYIGDGEAVTFKMYNHATGVEYTACTVTLGGEEISVVTGVDHEEYLFDSYNPVFLNFTTPAEPAVPAGPTTSGITWDASTNSGTFLMPAYDVEVSTELWYKLDATETLDDNQTNYGMRTDFFLDRTLTKDVWNTFASPFAIAADKMEAYFGAGAKVRKLDNTSVEEGYVLNLNFATATSIEAGKPYIVKPTAANVDFSADGKEFEGVDLTAAEATADVTTYVNFVPTLGKTTVTGNKDDILMMTTEGKLVHPSALGDMKGFRGYFVMHDAAEARAFCVNFGDGETTGISSLTPDPSPKGEGSIYTLDGRRMNGQPTRKGMYIKNGKKVIVK